ncbi:hypothetical protein [Pimelobacter sp. 30-1]|uniref:hypothetical protein n=1 Tax=Pimelobacter sp. 30-1 TaxID=2004991 RepID=UPI001C051FB1|nr:hypothetical protein [Pimelobacter sp. 30-1]MBU2693956.1 hypothetical protein [Pimelobacter sp. 30-1]
MSRKHGFWGHADEAKKWASRARRRDEQRDVDEQLRARGDECGDVRITRMLVQGDADTPFSVMVEPEAMSYDLPPHERVLLTFRGPMTTPQFEVVHGHDCLTIWRSPDTEVWATLADGTHEQIGGWALLPAPWLDSAHPDVGPPPWERS